MIKRARKVSNVHGEVHFKQKQRLTIAFTGNKLPHRKQSRKGAEDFIVDKITCHRHAVVPKLNSPSAPLRNHNKKIDSQKLKYKKVKTRYTYLGLIYFNIYIYLLSYCNFSILVCIFESRQL